MARSGDGVNNLLCVLPQEPDIVELAHVYVQDEKLISCAVTFNHFYKGPSCSFPQRIQRALNTFCAGI